MEEGDDLANSLRFSSSQLMGSGSKSAGAKVKSVEQEEFLQSVTEQSRGKDNQLYIYYNDQMIVVDNEMQQKQILDVLNQKPGEIIQIQCEEMEQQHRILSNLLEQMKESKPPRLCSSETTSV